MWCDVPKGGIFTIVKVESRHTRSQVGYWRVVILVHTSRESGGSSHPSTNRHFFYATKQRGGGYPTERENSYMGLSITGGIRPNWEGLGGQPGI